MIPITNTIERKLKRTKEMLLSLLVFSLYKVWHPFDNCREMQGYNL